LLQWVEQAFDPRRLRFDLLGATVVAAFAPDFEFDMAPAPASREYELRVASGRPAAVELYRPTAPLPRRAIARPHHATTRRRHRASVYRRRRIVAAGVLTVAFVGVGWAARAVVEGSGTALAPTRPIASRVYVVHPGDTLWGIALASGDKGDIRRLVDELSAEVHDQPLQVGERITLP
jgi:hypothetical protein